jgi:hypothetical protein
VLQISEVARAKRCITHLLVRVSRRFPEVLLLVRYGDETGLLAHLSREIEGLAQLAPQVFDVFDADREP